MAEQKRKDKSRHLDLRFDLGTVLHIEQERDGERIQTTVVGVLPQACLILKLPTIVGIDSPLCKNNPVQVRYVDAGDVYGFQSTVLGSISTPFPLTFLSFPRAVERSNVRRHPRIDCYIPTTLKFDVVSKAGIISDISRGGCRLKLRDTRDMEAAELTMGREVILYFPLLGLQGVRECSGIVRNITLDSEGISVGIEFDAVEAELLEMIESYTKTVADYQRV
jgi:c-di-GMP-binding flagellar brake protein YcgR